MAKIEQITFKQALKDTEAVRRHLLLGNGFSIALFSQFRYGSLLEEADFSDLEEAEEVFRLLRTADFEEVINALRTLAKVGPAYSDDEEMIAKAEADAEKLKDMLVQAIAGCHPERPGSIAEAQYQACRRFLGNFIGEARAKKAGRVYTVSYDLLLYWTALHDNDVDETERLNTTDGFKNPDDDDAAEYVVWDSEGLGSSTQDIHYLHGALHLFDDGSQLKKKCWNRAGETPLIEQIRNELSDNKFPLFVSEGHTKEKLARIRHHGYLHHSLKSFARICDTKDSALFIFGHSLAANDDHIIAKIEKGKISRVYISLYGYAGSDFNKDILSRAKQIIQRRKYPIEVFWFDAAEAKVWGV